MILIFGGTTEGRAAVNVIEEAGNLIITQPKVTNRISTCIMAYA